MNRGTSTDSEERVDSAASRGEWTRGLVAATTLSSLTVLVVGFFGAGATGLWRDEGLTLGISRRSIEGVLGVVANREANMSLYYVLLHGWIRLSGEGIVGLRGLSLLFAVLTVPLLVWVAVQLSGRTAGILTALLAPGSAVLLRNAAEARAYSLANLLAVLTVGLLVYALQRGSRVALAAAVLSATAMIYSQILSALLLVGLALGAATVPNRRVSARELGTAVVVLFVMVSPILWFSVARDRGQTSWIPGLGVRSVRELAATFGGSLVAVAALTAVVVAALVAARRTGGHGPLIFALSWLLIPPALLLSLSLFRPLFVPRYVATSGPALVLVTALVVLFLVAARWRWLVALLLVVLTVSGSVSALFTPRSDNVSAAAEFVNAHSTVSDVIIYDPATARGSIGSLIDGRVRDLALAAGGSPVDQRDVWGIEVSAPELARRLQKESRVWLVHYPGSTWSQTPEPAREVRGRVLPGAPQMRRQFGELFIELYQR